MAEIVELIRQLAGPEPSARAEAAGELYRRGRALGDAASAAWRADPQVTDLLAGGMTVGLAVQPDHFQEIRAANGSPRLATVPPDQDASEFELHFEGGISLDILTTRTPAGGGTIARFLEKFGEGIQQIEYATADVDRATTLLQERFGLAPIYPASRPGADGTRVNFFLASGPAGRKVLIELVESPPRV